MAEIIISESQYTFLKKTVDPKMLNEAKWYNTVMDILGIFDPTPTIDLINGFSYWKQGDKLYAFLSFISAVPYGGDLIGKGAKAVMAGGSKSAKLFTTGFNLIGTNPQKASKIFQGLSTAGGPIGNFIKTSTKWGPSILQKISKFPTSISGFSGFLKEIVEFLIKNARKMKSLAKISPSPSKSTEAIFDTGTVVTQSTKDPLINMFTKILGG